MDLDESCNGASYVLAVLKHFLYHGDYQMQKKNENWDQGNLQSDFA